MAKPSHPKLRMARRMLSRKERAAGVTPFNSKAWMARSNAIRARLGIVRLRPVLVPKSTNKPAMKFSTRDPQQKKPGFFKRLFMNRNFA